jgi:hypothetical protein
MQKFEVRETIIASEIFEQGRQSFLENLELHGNIISNTLRSTFRELLESHIGVELANTYFLCLKQKFAIHVVKDSFRKLPSEILLILKCK